MLADHILVSISGNLNPAATASDGFLNNLTTSSSPATTNLLELANHSTWTIQSFGGAWDDTSETASKTWCDECLNMIKSSGNVATQRSGAILLASAMAQLDASPNGHMKTVLARCSDGVVWLLKHCCATSLKNSTGSSELEVASFECCFTLLNILHKIGDVTKTNAFLNEIVPQLASMLSLGDASSTSLESLLRTTTTALVLFENQMRPYLGQIYGALIRSKCFVGMPSRVIAYSARCWSLVVSARSRTQKPKDDNSSNSKRNTVGTNALLDVPAHFWQEECMKVVNSIHDLLLHICPAAAKKVDPQEQRLFNLSYSSSSTDETIISNGGGAVRIQMTEVELNAHLEMLSYLMSSLLSTGPAGPPGIAMYAAVPVVAIIDSLERLIISCYYSQVDDASIDETGGLTGKALLSFVPRLYKAFGRIFPALVDAVSLLRYSTRLSTTLIRGLRFVSHGQNNVSCPAALISMLNCCKRYAIRMGAAMKQSFVEPVVTLCVHEVYLRMVSQPTNQTSIGAIVNIGSRNGGGRKGKKRGRNGNSSDSSSSSGSLSSSTETLSTEKILPISHESNASHRSCCYALVTTIECMLQSSVHHVGTVVRRDVQSLLYGLTNTNDPRPSMLMCGSSDVQDHSGVELRLAVYGLLTTCSLLPSASGNVGGGSLLGHAMSIFHHGLIDADWRIVQACRRSIVSLRALIYPQVAPMKMFESRVAPLAKRYKTAWPTEKKLAKKQKLDSEEVEENVQKRNIKSMANSDLSTPSSAAAIKVEEEDATPIEVEKVALEVMPERVGELKDKNSNANMETTVVQEEEEEDEDFPDIIA